MREVLAHDDLLPASWRARRGDFVSLMTLYESNYVRLKQLVPDVRCVQGTQLSLMDNDCRLSLRLEEHAAYTTTFNLTYVFATDAGECADPDLTVRVYHDAHLAEVLACARWHRHRVLASLSNKLKSELNDRWRRNVMLNKWLEYCLDRGHRFPASPDSALPADT